MKAIKLLFCFFCVLTLSGCAVSIPIMPLLMLIDNNKISPDDPQIARFNGPIAPYEGPETGAIHPVPVTSGETLARN